MTDKRLDAIRAAKGAIGPADAEWLLGEVERLQEVLIIPNITPDTTSSAMFIRTLSEHEKGQPVNTQDLINALMWRVKNQRREIARLQEKRTDEPSAFEQSSPRAYVEGLAAEPNSAPSAAGEVATEASFRQPGEASGPATVGAVHTTEDDFRHFLAYEQLSRQSPDELDRLRLAYYAGADAPRPAKTPRSIVQGADFVLEPADGMGRALYVKEGGGLREWNKLTQQQRAEWTIRARTLGEVCPRCQQTMPGGVTLHTHHCPALKSGDDHG